MRKRGIVAFWILTALVLAVAAGVVSVCFFCGGGEDTVAMYRRSVPADTSLIFLSDTQSPLLPETVVLSENRNKQARDLILGAIHRERPSAVFHCGDLVSLGFCDRDWTRVDAFVTELNTAGIPFFPVLGNHEVMLLGREGEDRFRRRYPYASRTGYSIRAGRVAVVLLNSNFNILSEHDARRQQQWLDTALAGMEADSTVDHIMSGIKKL